MGIVLGLALVAGIAIGLGISVLFGIAVFFMTLKTSRSRQYVWLTFSLAMLAFMMIFFSVIHYYPYDLGTPGSNYTILFKYFFFSGLAYALVPGIAAVLAFLTSLFCRKNPSDCTETTKPANRLFNVLLPILFLLIGICLGSLFKSNVFNTGKIKAASSPMYGKEKLEATFKLSENGKYQEAVQGCSETIESGSFKGIELGDIYLDRGYSRNRLGNHGAAIADFERTIQLNPKSASAFNGRGWAYMKSGKYPEAMADFETAIKLFPSYSMAFNNRGCTFEDLGRRDLARESYRKAVELNNNRQAKAFAIFNLGWLDYQDGQLKSALAYHEQGLGILPNDAMGYNNRGAILEDMGQTEKALTDYGKAIELGNDPEASAYAHLNRGVYFLMKSDYASANNDFMALFREKLPMKERAAVYLFISLKESGKSQKEIDNTLKALTQGSVLREWPASALDLFQSRISMDEFTASYWHTNKVKRSHQQAQMWFYAGQHFLHLGQIKNARACFEKCIKLNIRDLNETNMAMLRLEKMKSAKLDSVK
ncbi:MAG: hypothetical protein A2017_12370 [Lentisphaerae bacterium GWF2_44_16]|nr:MAG: hypothetical protein A2017_12370 [Lentisphaerae bacterium GWF2_44_16]